MDRRLRQILDRAEAELADVVAEYTAARQYDHARDALALIESVRELQSPDALKVEDRPRATTRRSDRRRPRKPSTSARGEYPKFKLERDVLVKIGWSRREKKEYEHRSPISTLDTLAKAITATARIDKSGTGRFSTDDLFPLTDTDGSALPSYQSYLCLAFLRSQNLIERANRSQYVAPSVDTLPDAAARAVQKLSAK